MTASVHRLSSIVLCVQQEFASALQYKRPLRCADEGALVVPPQFATAREGQQPCGLITGANRRGLPGDASSATLLPRAPEGLHRGRRPPFQHRRLSALQGNLLLVSIVTLY